VDRELERVNQKSATTSERKREVHEPTGSKNKSFREVGETQTTRQKSK
jgi:hypothetical protein